jgi:glycosyltransferase involved in cell wall biosynthesis
MQNTARRLTILYHHRTRSRDGQSIHIDEMIHAMRELGHTVIVVEPRRIDAMAEPVESRLLPRAIYELAELAYSVLEFAKLASAALTHRPDFLYERANLFMLSGLWVSKLFAMPYLLEVNAPLAEERGRHGGLFWQRLAAWTESACWRSASAVLPVTAALAQYVRRAGVADERIVVTPNGVDPHKFGVRDMTQAKRALGLADRLVLGFVGYVRDWHGLDRIVTLLAERPALKDAVLLIVGDGPARQALESQAEDLGFAGRVRFTGTVAHDALPDLIASFDIALQPKVTSYASPLKLFEYMAQGRAIVAPACPNIEEVLDDGEDACLFPPDQPEEMARAIELLSLDAELRRRLGAAAAQKIVNRDLTWRGNALRVISLGARRQTHPAVSAPERAG